MIIEFPQLKTLADRPWNASNLSDACNFAGVNCNPQGNSIVEVFLGAEVPYGTIPDSICNISTLVKLASYFNQVHRAFEGSSSEPDLAG
jgi:hypothetical protein